MLGPVFQFYCDIVKDRIKSDLGWDAPGRSQVDKYVPLGENLISMMFGRESSLSSWAPSARYIRTLRPKTFQIRSRLGWQKLTKWEERMRRVDHRRCIDTSSQEHLELGNRQRGCKMASLPPEPKFFGHDLGKVEFFSPNFSRFTVVYGQEYCCEG